MYGDRYTEILWRLKDEKKNKILIKNSGLTVGEVEFLIDNEFVEIPIDLLTRRIPMTF